VVPLRGPMLRIAIFGNAGGGKSTLARRLARLTQLPLHTVDMIQYNAAGALPEAEYLRAHTDLLARDVWIIDGFGTVETAWERFGKADTLIHVDLPLATHFWWVTKRLAKGLFVPPEGWPEGSPVWASSLNSYRALWLCHRHLTPRYRQLVAEQAASKCVYRLTSAAQIAALLEIVTREYQPIS
jgi:adenylate kinase family enzyme